MRTDNLAGVDATARLLAPHDAAVQASISDKIRSADREDSRTSEGLELLRAFRAIEVAGAPLGSFDHSLRVGDHSRERRHLCLSGADDLPGAHALLLSLPSEEPSLSGHAVKEHDT